MFCFCFRIINQNHTARKKIRAKARREALKRKGPDDPQVLREKKLAKKRQLKYRLKAKEQNPKDLPRTKQLGIDLKKERKTRQDEQAIMRQYWAEAKRRSREKLKQSPQAYRRFKERERNRKRPVKETETAKAESSATGTEQPAQPEQTTVDLTDQPEQTPTETEKAESSATGTEQPAQPEQITVDLTDQPEQTPTAPVTVQLETTSYSYILSVAHLTISSASLIITCLPTIALSAAMFITPVSPSDSDLPCSLPKYEWSVGIDDLLRSAKGPLLLYCELQPSVNITILCISGR